MWKAVVFLSIFCGYASLAQEIKLSVYYESLCPDSIRFLVNQFHPAYETYAENLVVDLVPYGKASTTNESGSLEFECQHGEAECYGNKVHSCAIDIYSVSLSTEFVVCAMDSGNASSDVNLEACAVANNISWPDLQTCVSSGRGAELLAANGLRTDLLIPDVINFVPTVVFNDVFNLQLHTLSQTNFNDTLVFILEQVQCGFCQFSGAEAVFRSGKFVVVGITLLLLIFQKFIS